jgi:hypothetical protein
MSPEKMIDEILAWCADHPDEVEARAIPETAFRDMSRSFSLSEKQVAWVKGIYEKLFDVPTYLNEFSAGRVPLGTKLATPVPEVLKKPLPLKPPGRR